MPSMLVLDDLPREAINRLNAAAHLDYEIHTGFKGPELGAMLGRFDGVICRAGARTIRSCVKPKRQETVFALYSLRSGTNHDCLGIRRR